MLSAFIYLQTRSYQQVGLAEAVQGIMSVTTSFPAGVAADRWRRDKVLYTVQPSLSLGACTACTSVHRDTSVCGSR